MKKTFIYLMLLSATAGLFAEPKIINPAQKHNPSFAILVDSTTNARIGQAILAYRDAVEYDGLSTYIVSANWHSPDEIKSVIINLYKATPPLEGVVFIGDIPVPMLRDAQHLTSAFKMDPERYVFQRSSVPSDRFYDDFDLKFDFLKQDTTNRLLFYYSLRADCPQKVEREIYSARIFPPINSPNKYELIAKYLTRVVQQKQATNRLDNIMTYAGHGYHSESLDAWNNNLTALREQFPHFSSPGYQMTNLYHSMSPDMKSLIMSELQKPELDLAIFHAHGEYDTQYLLGFPPAGNINENIEAAKLFVRGKMREARDRQKSVDDIKKYYQSEYNLPDSWFENALDDSVEQVDSLYSASLDLYSSDVAQIAPQAEIVVFDECFNGAFIKPDYVAGTYLFGNGTTIAEVANTVNVKQDIWSDELLGLFSYGVRIGEWHKMRNYLESHLFGDPTFHYYSMDHYTALDKLNPNLKDLRIWQKELKATDPVRRTLAVRQIYKIQGAGCETTLLEIYRTDSGWNVRLEALKCLADLRSPGFQQVLLESIYDPFELIRRFSANLMGVVGDEKYLEPLSEKVIFDASERVGSTAKAAIVKISPEKTYQVCKTAFDSAPVSNFNNKQSKICLDSFSRSVNWLNDELITNTKNDSLKNKDRISAIRSFRNYQFREAIPVLIQVAADVKAPPEVRVSALEALGWFSFSLDRNLISDACDRIIKQLNVPESVRQEALKTHRRIADGCNDSLNP